MFQEPRELHKAAKQAYKAARHADKYRYGKQKGGVFSLLVLIICLAFYLLSHAWVWIIAGVMVIAVLVALVLLFRAGQSRSSGSAYQQSYPPQYQPSQITPQSEYYQPYQEGYHNYPGSQGSERPRAEMYREGGRQWQYQDESREPEYAPRYAPPMGSYRDYEGPDVQYPEQRIQPKQ